MRISLFLSSVCRRKSRLKRGISDFRAQLIDPLLGPVAFGRSRLLTDHFVVVDDGGAIIFLLIVKFRHFVGTCRLFTLKKLKVSACLRGFLAVWIVKEEILEGSSGIAHCRNVLSACSRGREPDVTDLILRIHRDRLVRKLVHYCLVSLKSSVISTLLLAREANVKLRTCGVLSVRRCPNNVRKNRDGAVQGGCIRDTE